MCGRNFSAFLLTPPPTMMSSGQRTASTSSKYVWSRVRPLLPRELFALAYRLGRPVLGDAAVVERKVPELGVRYEHAVDEDRAADARCRASTTTTTPCAVAAGAEAHLGDARGVGVVDAPPRAAGRAAEQLDRVGPDPAPVDVRRGLDDAALDDGRQRETDRARRVELVEEVLHDPGDGFGRRRRRGEQADPVGGELPGREIDGRALDAGTADVDPDGARPSPPTRQP